MEEFARLISLIGEAKFKKLQESKIVVVGLGGVGGYALEGLARSGIEHFIIVDDDKVCASNINRQIIALHSNIDRPKVEVWKERLLDINPNIEVKSIYARYSEENPIDFSDATYVVDAIDSLKCKAKLIVECTKKGIPIISSMGTGGKLDAEYKVADIYKTQYDPMARKLRKMLRPEGVEKLKTVYCEECNKSVNEGDSETVFGTIVYSPANSGMLIVREIVKDIINER